MSLSVPRRYCRIAREWAPPLNVDYILMLVEQHRAAKGDGDDREIRATIDSSPSLRNKKDLIQEFVDRVTVTEDVSDEWRAYVEAKRTAELERIITEENLRPEQTRAFVESAFRDGQVRATGTAITTILPTVSRFAKGSNHGAKKQTVIDKLTAFFERFSDLT